MQNFDKTFQDGFNSYLKIGDNAINKNDIGKRGYVDYGNLGSIYSKNFEKKDRKSHISPSK